MAAAWASVHDAAFEGNTQPGFHTIMSCQGRDMNRRRLIAPSAPWLVEPAGQDLRQRSRQAGRVPGWGRAVAS